MEKYGAWKTRRTTGCGNETRRMYRTEFSNGKRGNGTAHTNSPDKPGPVGTEKTSEIAFAGEVRSDETIVWAFFPIRTFAKWENRRFGDVYSALPC